VSNGEVLRRSFGSERLLVVPADGSLSTVAAALAQRPTKLPSTQQEIEAARKAVVAMMAQFAAAAAPISDVRIRETRLDGVAALVLEPPVVRGAVLHLHGGGWYLGDPSIAIATLSRWSHELGLVIASLDYRLAPEHRCPAAQEDCERGALAWLEYLRRRHPGIRVAITGESAGAHLAVVTAVRLCRRHNQRFDSALLTYGMYDLANAVPSRDIADSFPGTLDSRTCDFLAETYLQDARQGRHPDVSPLRAPLSALRDMPPALFVCAALDALADDSVLLHNRWIRAGNAAWLAVYEEAVHGFDIFPGTHAQHLGQLQLEFFADSLNVQPR
jgi:acetyl esterase/lipase